MGEQEFLGRLSPYPGKSWFMMAAEVLWQDPHRLGTRPQVRVLGVKIASGSSAEAGVFAALLAHRGKAYDALVLHHAAADDQASALRFAADSEAPQTCLDTGWRWDPDQNRSRLMKVVSRLRLLQALPAMERIARAYRPDVVYSSQQQWD